MDKIYEMKLHDEVQLDSHTLVKRIPGGWLYIIDAENGTGGYDLTSTFVPFDNEFMKEKK